MSFFLKLKKRLEGKIPETLLDKLPRSYSLLGKVVIIKLRDELLPYKSIIGKEILSLLPVKSVCRIDYVKGEKRKPIIEVIAGNGTETIHKEHGCLYKLDVKKVMFSKGNKYEKIRLVKSVKKDEKVLDMFSGIGYFTIPLAKLSQARIVSIDINKEAIKYLKENVKLNKVEDRVKIICGDSKLVGNFLKAKFDRIIMGYFYDMHEFFVSALQVSKPGTIIHYHFLGRKEEIDHEKKTLEKLARNFGFKLEFLTVKKIKSYAPRVYHFVFDIKLY